MSADPFELTHLIEPPFEFEERDGVLVCALHHGPTIRVPEFAWFGFPMDGHFQVRRFLPKAVARSVRPQIIQVKHARSIFR